MDAAEVLLVCALDLLGRSRDTFPIIRIVQERPAGVSDRAVAFVDRRDRSINLVAASPPLREAIAAVERFRGCRHRADAAIVAGILAHEEWHLRHGPDEAAAYANQLTTLHALGFGPGTSVYHGVQRATLAVAERGRP